MVPLSPGTEDDLGQHLFNVHGSSEEPWGLEGGEPLPPPFSGSLTTSALPTMTFTRFCCHGYRDTFKEFVGLQVEEGKEVGKRYRVLIVDFSILTCS